MNEQEMRNLYQGMIAERSVERREGCLSAEQLLALAEGQAPDRERVPWMLHVGGCPRCRGELMLLQAVAEAGEAKPRRRMPAFALALAASLALFVVGGAVVWRGWSGNQPDVMRGGGSSITLISPAGNVPIEQGRVLTWRALPRASDYEVEILGSTGEVIFITGTPDTSVTLPAGTSLAPGTAYRWRVTARLPDGARPGSKAQEFKILPQ